MNKAVHIQIGRVAKEFAMWRAVPDGERSPAPAWWWGPAIQSLDAAEALPADLCADFELSPGSSYGAGAELLMQALSEQTSLPWPDEFPRKFPQPDTASAN